MAKPIMAAFNQRAVPTIACINLATVPLGVDFDALIPALQKFLDDCFVPVWGSPAKLVKANKPLDGAAELKQFSVDTGGAPQRVGPAHAADQITDFCCDLRSTQAA